MQIMITVEVANHSQFWFT